MPGGRKVPPYFLYGIEVSAPVRMEPACFKTRRGAFEAFRFVEGVLGSLGYLPDPGGDDALVVLVATRKDGTQRVRAVRRYRAKGSSRDPERARAIPAQHSPRASG